MSWLTKYRYHYISRPVMRLMKQQLPPISPTEQDALESGRGESVKPGDPRLARSETHLITTPQVALEAAAEPVEAEPIQGEVE